MSDKLCTKYIPDSATIGHWDSNCFKQIIFRGKILHFLIQLHLSYGLCVYGAKSEENVDQIVSKKQRGIRIMLEMKTTESVEHYLFAHFKNLTGYVKYVFKAMKFVKEHDSDITYFLI